MHQATCAILLLVLFFTGASCQLREVELTCVYCNASFYCADGYRFVCPRNSLSTDFASQLDDCICEPGYFQNAPDSCIVGVVPHYYDQGVRLTCPGVKETTHSLASRVQDCVCVPGYEHRGDYMSTCDRCEPGKYSNLFNTSACPSCPENSWHNNYQATSNTFCKCDPGYSGPDGGPCKACEAGTFKQTNGSAACVQCEADTYSLEAAIACLDCPSHSSSDPGSGSFADCLCHLGYELQEDLCQPCDIGFYKDTTGSSACQQCPEDTRTATTASIVCEPCPVNADPREDLLTCDCVDGYGHVGAADADVPNCQACAIGEYYTATSSGPPTHRTGCEECPGNSTTQAIASANLLDCFCNAGFVVRDDVHACVACEAGKYKSTIGFDHDAACVLCPVNSFSETEASVDVTACMCNAGYTGVYGGLCEACPAGKYKSARGSEACQDCAADTYSDTEASTVCTDCIPNSLSPVGSPSSDSCVCDHTSGWSEKDVGPGEPRECVNCQAGKYVNQYSQCVACSAGTYTALPGATVCLACASNTTSIVNESVGVLATECVCVKGFKCRGGVDVCHDDCVRCPQHTFKDYVGYAASCEACPLHSQAPPQSDTFAACQCNVGYYHEEDACAGCEPGTFSDFIGSKKCTLCPNNTFTPPSSFPFEAVSECETCSGCPVNERDAAHDYEGCSGAIDSICEVCPANSGNDAVADQHLRDGNDCACNTGFYGPINGPCLQCVLGKFTENERSFADENVRCLDCNGYTDRASSLCLQCYQNSVPRELAYSKHHCQCIAGHTSGDADIILALQTFDSSTLPLDHVLPLYFFMASGIPDVEYTAENKYLLDDGKDTACPKCAFGKFKTEAGNYPCSDCPAETHGPVRGLLQCLDCPENMNQPLTGQAQCLCNVGFEPNADNSVCELCQSGTFKVTADNVSCATCSACGQNEQVATLCNATHDITCKPCQANSHADQRTTLGLCLCNAGYELQNDECVACEVGKFRTTNINNSVLCASCPPFTFTTDTATVECTACSPICQDLETRQYVLEECIAERDIICSDCTVCEPGTYANRTCGVSYGGDRRDTHCVTCPAGAYCPGGDAGIVPCFEDSSSEAGASQNTDCTCLPGFHLSAVDQCTPCSVNTYCPGNNLPVDCPDNSKTYGTHSTHRLDCHCNPGFYRKGAEDTFECPVCTVDDYCFNNSRFNCSDPLMRAPSGSDNAADCVCITGFYNSDTSCKVCPENSFCVGNKLAQPCPEHEWTNGLTGQSACVCRPGFTRVDGSCVVCAANFFCPGTADEQLPCTDNAVAAPGSSVATDCTCIAGFQNHTTYSLNLSTAVSHVCVECSAGFFKDIVGNFECGACTICRPAAHGVYEIAACRSAHDAVCSPCETCTDGDIFISQICQTTSNAVCSTCTQCNFDIEFQSLHCSPAHNRECSAILFTRECAAGEYAGGHTQTSNSLCLPCQYRDELYYGWRLHTASSSGLIYNDPYSCEASCVQFAVLRDPLNHSLGCRTCETGNVLLRNQLDDPADIECRFECKPGYTYDAARGDCFVSALKASPQNSFTHHLAIADFVKTENGFVFTVAHSNHSRFVVVVGSAAPGSCKHDECCWQGLWRVSTLAQLGAVQDPCSESPALVHEQIDSDVLKFTIAESQIAHVAECSFEGLRRECSLVVSIVDTVLRQSYSRTVLLYADRAVEWALLSGPKKIVPLAQFQVQVLKAYETGETDVYLVTTTAASVGPQYNMTTHGSGMTYESTPQLCQRLPQQHTVTNSITVTSDIVTTSSYWAASRDADTLRWFFTLDGGNGNIMDIAAVRNVSTLEPVCTPTLSLVSFERGFVEAAAGLGAEAIERGTVTGLYTHGELGTLLTFFGFASDPAVTSVIPHSALAAHVTQATTTAMTMQVPNATELRAGNLGFRPAFRAWCRAHECQYEYLHIDLRGRTMFALADCSSDQKRAAKSWIVNTLGAVHDAGHVDAVCERLAQHSLASGAVLLNSLAYAPAPWRSFHDFTAPDTHTHAWVQFAFE